MFRDLDESIRTLLVRHVPLDMTEVDVSFEAPDREWSGRLTRPTVNCFLYDVRENLELRETDWEVTRDERTTYRKKTSIRVNATYQVTVWAKAPEDEHHLLWRVLSALARHPVLPDEVAEGQIQAQPFPVLARTAQPDLARANPADFWQAVENRIRPALTYIVTLALDPEVVIESPVTFGRAVRTAPPREIVGRVRDRQKSSPIAGAVVVLRETATETTTDRLGNFAFRRAPDGGLNLDVRTPDRREVTQPVGPVEDPEQPRQEVEVEV